MTKYDIINKRSINNLKEQINYAGGIMEYKIQLLWDNEASVWVATSPDVPGLVLESGSFDALIERVRYAIPELLELNRQKAPFYNLTFLSERHERVNE